MRDIYNLPVVARSIHAANVARGFYDDEQDANNVHFQLSKLAMIHSEVSEVVEAVRKPGADGHLPEFSGEVVELADVLIRILDYVAWRGIEKEFSDALAKKDQYNRDRPHRHGGKLA